MTRPTGEPVQHVTGCPAATGGAPAPFCCAPVAVSDTHAPDFVPEREFNAGGPVVPHEKFPEGRIGAPWAAGYCAPSGTGYELPDVRVPRGGLKFPTGEEAARRERTREWWAGFRLYQTERTKRRKETLRTVRGVVVILAALVLLLALGDALPWQ